MQVGQYVYGIATTLILALICHRRLGLTKVNLLVGLVYKGYKAMVTLDSSGSLVHTTNSKSNFLLNIAGCLIILNRYQLSLCQTPSGIFSGFVPLPRRTKIWTSVKNDHRLRGRCWCRTNIVRGVDGAAYTIRLRHPWRYYLKHCSGANSSYISRLSY
jgi:hypothetical protein